MPKTFKYKRPLCVLAEDAQALLRLNPPVLFCDKERIYFINRKRENSHLLYFEFIFVWEGGDVMLVFPKTRPIEFLKDSGQHISEKKEITIQINRRTGEVFEIWS